MSVKRNRSSEQVQNAVGRYLQKRRYSNINNNGLDNNNLATTQSVQQLALVEILHSEASANDIVIDSLQNICEPNHVEQQYTKFKVWISESPDVYKPELAQLLYPMFTHLFLDLVKSGHKLLSQKFHKRHQSTFMGNAEFSNFIRILSVITTAEEIAQNESVSAYHESKYSVTLSAKTFHYLMKYVHHGDNLLLLHLLRSRIDLKLSDPLAACSKPEAVQRIRSDQNRKQQEQQRNKNENDDDDDDILKLRETIQNVRAGATPLPSTCLYRISSNNSQSALTSSTCSFDSQLMAIGSENSSVYLYNLFPIDSSLSSSSSSSVNDEHSRIHLSCDFLLFDDDDEDDEEDKEEEEERNRVLLGHCGPVYDVKFVSNKNFVLSVSEDTTMRIWESSVLSNKAIYRGHSYPVWCLDVDRMGYNVVTGSMDRTAKLWNLEYTFPIRIYAGHEKDVDCIQFHPNCNYFATGSVDKSIRLWSHADGKMVRVLTGHKSGVYSLAFSPDGKYLASGGEDRRIRIWDLASSHQLKELKGHTDTIYALVWSADSSLLASGGLDGAIRIWDMNSSSSSDDSNPSVNSTSELVASHHTNCFNILDLSYSHHNTLLATAIVEESSKS